MLYDRPERRPDVVSARTLGVALLIHLAFFLVFWVFAVFHGLFDKKEEIIPIDLTVVVNENLDGVENEPPPVKNPDPPEPPKPEPPKPKAPPKVKEPEKPKELEKIVTNIVAKVDKKPEKKVEKKPEKKKPEKPKKTKAQLRKERLEQMRKSAKVNNKPVKIEVKDATASGNGRTERQTRTPEEIRRLLEQGYRPGTKTQIAPNMMSHCVSLIQRALDEKWARLSPSVGASGTVLLSAQFGSNGGMVNVRIAKSCGDKVSDAAALSVARSVNFISGLDPEFLAQFRHEPLTIRYRVQGQ